MSCSRMILRKIRSGGQTGADQAGLVVAKKFGLETGGVMPKNFKTLDGPMPQFAEMYGMSEHHSDNYVTRTFENVRDSDGTVRLAKNFDSRGEVCTLKAIEKYGKPYFDVDLAYPLPSHNFVNWLKDNCIVELNVAGNSEQSCPGAFRDSVKYLTESLFHCGLEMRVSDEEILSWLDLSSAKMIIYTENRTILKTISIRAI